MKIMVYYSAFGDRVVDLWRMSRKHSVTGAAKVPRHVIARAAARGNLTSPTNGDCFVVSLLAKTILIARACPAHK
jgi:hypothetical protein